MTRYRTPFFMLTAIVGVSLSIGATATLAGLQIKEYKSGIVWPEPQVVTPGKTDRDPPSDAVVLFDGKDLSKWDGGETWEVADGVATSKKRDITTKDSFGDCQLHIEFATPEKVSGSGQGRGNSGVFMMNHYEVQILDSYDNQTYFDGQCASIYKQTPPMVNACRKPGEWQTYEILFNGPKFGARDNVLKPAVATVIQNGVAVQNHYEWLGSTSYFQPPQYEKHAEKMPIRLQYHGNPVRFRNIWIRAIKQLEGKKP